MFKALILEFGKMEINNNNNSIKKKKQFESNQIKSWCFIIVKLKDCKSIVIIRGISVVHMIKKIQEMKGFSNHLLS